MKKEKSRVAPVVPDDANDILETSELIRSANCLLRMAVGVLGFANDLCRAEVFPESERKELDSAINLIFKAFEKCYASLMGRYSALKSSENVSGDSPLKS